MKARATRGTVLILAIFFMAMATFLAHAFLALLPSADNLALRARARVEASLACRAGVEESINWMLSRIGAGHRPAVALHTGELLGRRWSWRARVAPLGAGLYRIVSRARRRGASRDCEQVTAWLTVTPSLARWAWFEGAARTRPLRAPDLRVDGPARFNGSLQVVAARGHVPVFRGRVGVAGGLRADRSRVFPGGVYTAARPVAADWTVSSMWRGDRPGAAGVTVSPAGVYVRGRVRSLSLEHDHKGHARFVFRLVSGVTRVLEGSDTTVISAPGRRSVVKIVPRPVIFVDGDLLGLHGTAVAPLTVAVTGTLWLDGNVGHRPGQPLGLVARRLGLTRVSRLKLAAAVAADSLTVEGSGPRQVDLDGSLLLKRPASWLRFRVHYDPNLAYPGPPDFPRATGTVRLLAWKEARLAP